MHHGKPMPSADELAQQRALYQPHEQAVSEIVAAVDAVAAEMESKWGRSRLHRLNGALHETKFESQRTRLDGALEANLLAGIRQQGDAMIRAWQAHDRMAAAAGHKPLPHQAIEITLSDGTVVAIVPTSAHGAQIRDRIVYTGAEIAELIERLGAVVLETKRTFLGAEIKSLGPVNWAIGDPIDDLFPVPQ